MSGPNDPSVLATPEGAESDFEDDGARQRFKLARTWAYVLSQTAYLPWPHRELEQRLSAMVDDLVEAMTSRPFSDERAARVGARLVEWRCTDPSSLRRSLDVLGKGLLSLPELTGLDGVAKRIVAVFGALAAAYSDAMRLFTIEQQENLNHALRNVKQHLLSSEARFEEVAASSASGIAITDLDGHFVRTNTAFGRILGYTPTELAGLSLFDVVHLERAEQLRELYEDLLAGPTDRLRQVGLLHKDEGTARVSLTASLLRSVDGVPNQFVTVVEDATELALLQDELLRQSIHDLSTGLPNRQYFTSRLEAILHAPGPTAPITVYHLDLDAFSLVVGGLGLRVGQRLLTKVAERLLDVMDGEDAMVAKFESDEFGILVENSPDTPNVGATVDSINEVLSEPIYIGGEGVAVTASVGVVHLPPADLGPLELLAAAEMTLRRAQRNGRRQWELFDPEQDVRDREWSRLAISMPGAWETGELRAAYQPLVRLADDEVVGLEALLRWNHPELGELNHALCVELAERTGLIVPLGTWLLRSAAELVTEWDRLDGNAQLDVNLHVDLSPSQSADHNLVGAILRTLDETGVDPGRLRLTMPASALPADSEATANLKLLAEMGIGMVLRDFGTGPADLASLAEVPVHSVRLAKWQVPPDEPSGLVLTALVAAVHSAGSEVIVGDVVDEQQAHWWRAVGVDTAHGAFFSPPRPATEIANILR